MLQSDDLLVVSKLDLYETVMQYVNAFDNLKKKGALKQLLPQIH